MNLEEAHLNGWMELSVSISSCKIVIGDIPMSKPISFYISAVLEDCDQLFAFELGRTSIESESLQPIYGVASYSSVDQTQRDVSNKVK